MSQLSNSSPRSSIQSRLHRLSSGYSKRSGKLRRRSPLLLFLLLLLWSAILGWGLAQAASPDETVDPVLERYQLGQQFYLENCAACHIALPPAVMPTQTWADLLQDSQHYGVQITPLVQPSLQITWNYVSTYSRPVLQNERTPYRLRQSRYFKALHPKVEFTEPPTVNSCIACHPAAAQFNFRSLTPEWENAP